MYALNSADNIVDNSLASAKCATLVEIADTAICNDLPYVFVQKGKRHIWHQKAVVGVQETYIFVSFMSRVLFSLWKWVFLCACLHTGMPD